MTMSEHFDYFGLGLTLAFEQLSYVYAGDIDPCDTMADAVVAEYQPKEVAIIMALKEACLDIIYQECNLPQDFLKAPEKLCDKALKKAPVPWLTLETKATEFFSKVTEYTDTLRDMLSAKRLVKSGAGYDDLMDHAANLGTDMAASHTPPHLANAVLYPRCYC